MRDIDWYVGAQDTRIVQLLVCPANILKSSVADPWHFGTNPDPDLRIRTSDLRIRIQSRLRIRFQILLFSSVTFKMAATAKFFCLLRTFWSNIYIILKNKKSESGHKTVGIKVFLTVLLDDTDSTDLDPQHC